MILANLVLGENVVPEFLQRDARPSGWPPLCCRFLADTPERRRQTAAFARLDAIMGLGRLRPATAPPPSVLELCRAR